MSQTAGAAAALSAFCVLLSGCGGSQADAPPPPPPPPPSSDTGQDPGSGGNNPGSTNPPATTTDPDSLSTGPEDCTDGSAGDFACSGIALESRVALDTMGATGGNDIWGWADEQTGKEYALMGLTNGTGFVDISDPENPVYLGSLPTQTVDSSWRDIKVYSDHAYVVADGAGEHGMQIFDLTRLRGAGGSQTFSEDMLYDGFGHSHNLAINEATGFAYAVSTDTCDGGLHIMNLRTPNNPLFAGCHNVTRTHDTQCVVYRGPDAEHRDREICFSSNEDDVEIVDVQDKSAPVTLSTATYSQLGYAHQGWLTEDHRYFLLGDELDEFNFDLSTRTHVFDVSDLDAPAHLFVHDLGTSSIDHNLYVQGNRVFQANYTTGLRVLEFGDLAARDIREIAFFDTLPGDDSRSFQGAWSVYPYLPSGTLIVSDIENGLFVLSMQ
ncbi:MAG: choice-of-anchor B family protein [Gammaproteobacteria bacterium]|nr:choice-of-anchor B family protein [Gammaproteobacteria bacterium]